MLSPEILQPVIDTILKANRCLLAYSGGVDSRVLLHLLALSRQQYRQETAFDFPELVAVHIDHQLQKESANWARHCSAQAQLQDVPCSIHRVDIDMDERGSLEDKARQARYQVFESLMQPGDVLLLAHHIDDQVETVLMRLLRGSGSRGLAAMPAVRVFGCGQLLRPLLTTSRSDIEHYARINSLQWVNDPSNLDSNFDRNYLRQEVLPLLAQRWPQYRSTLSRSAQLSEETAQLNSELAEVDFHALSLDSLSLSLAIPALQELSTARQKNLIRYWLEMRALPLPSAAQMQAVLVDVIHAAPDAKPIVQWFRRGDVGVQIRRFKNELYAMEALADFDKSASYCWNCHQSLSIKGVGKLSAKRDVGTGLKLALLEKAPLTVKFRKGGERCQPLGRAASQTLKKLFQEYQIEPWKRERIPLIFIDGELAQVVGYWICEGFAAQGEKGVEIALQKG